MNELYQNRLARMENFEEITPSERREDRRAERDSLEKWAAENKIEVKYLRLVKGKGLGEYRGRMSGRNNIN